MAVDEQQVQEAADAIVEAVGALAPTADGLEAVIAAAAADRAEAEAALGEAALGGKGAGAARRRIAAADDDAAAARAALAALGRREAAEEEAAAAERASGRRLSEYEYAVDCADAAERMLEAQAACRAAEDAAVALAGDPRGLRFARVRRGDRFLDRTSIDLDADVTAPVPAAPPRTAARHAVTLGPRMTVERCRALRELAARRADEERRGAGRDWSGVAATATREQAEVRARRRAEREASQRRAEEERVRERREQQEREEEAGRRAAEQAARHRADRQAEQAREFGPPEQMDAA